jgi:hypothetical protein
MFRFEKLFNSGVLFAPFKKILVKNWSTRSTGDAEKVPVAKKLPPMVTLIAFELGISSTSAIEDCACVANA